MLTMPAHLKNTQAGAVLVLVSLLLSVMLVGLGLVIDSGHAYDMKRRLQKAADAGAIGAVQEIRSGNRSGYLAAAIKNAGLNGVTVPEAQINVHQPPITGGRAGNSNFVEVVIRRESPLYFARVFFDKQLVVEARAVAGVVSQDLCVLALSDSASAALQVGGNAAVDLGNCSAQVNSSAFNAMRSLGGATLVAADIHVTGGYTGSGFSPAPFVGADPALDPLADLAAPATGNCDYNDFKAVAGQSLRPGVYCGGIEVPAQVLAELDKGVYVLKGGGLTVRGGATIKGEEVMFYNTKAPYSPISFAGNSTAMLSAPRSGPYAGILFYTDRTISGGRTNIITGTADSYFTGALYFPHTPLTIIGTAGMEAQKVSIIADTVEFQGNVQIEAMTDDDGLSPHTLSAALVY